MARDTFAVPATGAGVERMFSKSDRVATWTRARLHSMTIVETMLYKEFLGRLGHSLNEAEERQKVERKKDKKKMKITGQCISQSENQAVDSESDDEEKEQQLMID